MEAGAEFSSLSVSREVSIAIANELKSTTA